MAEVIEKVKNLRTSVSECIEYTKSLPGGSKEKELAQFRAEEAFMFLGKLLGMIGEPSPYPSDHVKAVGLKVADVFEGRVTWDSPSTLDNIKQIRIMLQKVISSSTWNELFDITTVKGQPFVKYNSLSWQVTSHSLLSLMASKMWLGMMLNEHALRLHKEAEIGAKLSGSQPGSVSDNAAGAVDPDTLKHKPDEGQDNDKLKEALVNAESGSKTPDNENQGENQAIQGRESSDGDDAGAKQATAKDFVGEIRDGNMGSDAGGLPEGAENTKGKRKKK